MLKSRNKETQSGSVMQNAVVALLALVAILAFVFGFIIAGVISVSAAIAIALWQVIKQVQQKQQPPPLETITLQQELSNIETSNKSQSFSDKVKYEKKRQKPMFLFCFDFDNTITQEHTHNILIKNPDVIKNGGAVNDENMAKALVTKLAFKFKAENELAETFKSIYKEGHNIAVVCYHSFPLVVKEVLRGLLVKAGIPVKELKLKGEDGGGRVYINAILPLNSQEYHMRLGKNEFIQDAMANFHMDNLGSEAQTNVILIDDDEHNRDLASALYRVIEVDPKDPNYNMHLKKAREIIYDSQSETTLDSELDKIISSN